MNIGRLPQRGWPQKTCTRGAQPWKSTCPMAYLRPYPQGPFRPGSVWPCFWGLCPRLSLCRQNPGLNCAGLVHPPNVALCYEISLKSQGLSLCIAWLTHKATVPSQPPGSLAAGPPTLAGTDSNPPSNPGLCCHLLEDHGAAHSAWRGTSSENTPRWTSCPTTASRALYSRWQPWGLAKVSPVKPGLQRSQRSPCTCSLHTHWPVSGSQGAPGTAPSGSHSQAERQKQHQSSEEVPGGSAPNPHSTVGFQSCDPSQAWNPLCLVPHLRKRNCF